MCVCFNGSLRATEKTIVVAYFVYANGTALTSVQVEIMLSDAEHFPKLIELGLDNIVSTVLFFKHGKKKKQLFFCLFFISSWSFCHHFFYSSFLINCCWQSNTKYFRVSTGAGDSSLILFTKFNVCSNKHSGSTSRLNSELFHVYHF